MTSPGRSLSPLEQAFFERFFQELSRRAVPFVLLRNYQEFPARIGHDLDVFFQRSDFVTAQEIFLRLLRETKGEILHVQKLDYVLAVWFRAAPAEPQAIHLDFFHGAFTWHNLRYLGDEELIGQSVPFRDLIIPRPAHEALNLFLQSLLWGGFFKIRYRDRIRELLSAPAEAAEFWRLMDREFGTRAKPPFDLLGEQIPSGPEQQEYAAALRCTLRRRMFFRNPPATLFRLARHWRQEFANILSPPGVHIAILGPDGSGKSTIIEAVKMRLDDYFGEKVEGHWRPSLLPDVGVLAGKREKQSGPVANPHGQRPHSTVTSLLRLVYYWVDYWIGWPLRIRKPAAGNCLVLYDRYAADMWCDARRYRLKLPDALLKFFSRFVPQPDFTFVLVADAQTIHARKGEVPLETLRALLQRYTNAAKIFRRTRLVDCNRPVADIADEISRIVLEHLKTKLHRDHQ